MKRKLFIGFILMIFGNLIFGVANAQQVIGSFPTMDGGFEGQTAGTIITGLSTTAWSVSLGTSTTRTITNGSGRTGSKFATFGSSHTGAVRLQSPSASIVASTAYTVQFYYKAGATAPTNTDVAASSDGATNGVFTAITLAANTSNWTKLTGSVTTGSTSAAAGWAGFRLRSNSNGQTFDIDDFVIYAGAVDTEAPGVSSNPTFSSVTSAQQTLNWAAPGAGVDGGGYMVIKYTSDPSGQPDPQVNGIYAVGQSIGSGTIKYLGTNTSYTDQSLNASTTYYYRVYTVDKAFNYSTALSASNQTSAPSLESEPSTQVTNANISNITSSSFDVSWTAGNGTNNIVVIKQGSAVDSNPVDGSTYTANPAFGSGTQIGSGNYVVYAGTGTSVSVTGLSKNRTYYVSVFSYNATSSGTENYLTSSPATGSQLTNPGSISSTGTNSTGTAWSSISAWTGGVVPTVDDNVTIVAGDKILLTSTVSCYNLTIDATAKLYNNTALPIAVGSVQYITMYGTSLTCNGTLGDKTDASADCAVGINFANNLAISGTGTISIARLRPNTNAQNVTCTIDANITTTYAGTDGLGGNSINFDNSGNDNIGLVINSGKTLTTLTNSHLSAGSGVGTNSNASNTITINGTLNVGGGLSVRIASGKTSTLTINGSLSVRNLYASSATGGSSPTITNNGTFTISGTNANADFSGSTVVTGTGTFNLASGSTISVGAADGLNPTTGPIRCTTRNFNTAANYSFVGTSAQTSGADFPATVNNLTINNAAGVTLSNALAVSGTVTLTSGILQTAYTLTTNGAVSVTANGAFQLNAGGWATGTGVWTYASGGTLIFNNTSSYGVNNGDVFWPSTNSPTNVTVLQGGLTLNSANRTIAGTFQTASGVTLNTSTLTLNGTCQINAGGYFNQAPTYGVASTLKYNTGGTYGRGTEWSSTNPANLQLSNSTTLNYPNGSSVASKSLTGNLSIDAGSSLYMDYGSPGQSGSLTFGGNATINGNLSLGDAVGGDLYVGGNWSRAASGSTFNANSRAVFFNGSGAQTVSNTGGETFTYLNITNTGSGVTLSNNISATQLNVSAGSALTNSATLTATTFNLSSTASGTGTYIDNGTSNITTTNVDRYLGAIRNWYITSPVATVSAPSTNITRYYEYVEPQNNSDFSVTGSTANWLGHNTGFSMTAGKGYIAQASAATTLTFSGALNNNSQYATPVTWTSAPSKAGFNLVGNPYPAYLDWSLVIADAANTNIGTTMWYRTKNTGDAYTFATHNGTSGMTVTGTANTTISKFIPPMQAFWIRVNDGTASTNFTVKKTMLAHRDQNGNTLKAPKAISQSVLRLLISNDINSDESVLYFNPNASNNYDAYDSPKMSNNNVTIPEIYTLAGNEQLVINGMNSIPYNVEIPLGFVAGQTNTYKIKASELTGFDVDTQVYLMDKLLNTETQLDGMNEYSFSSEVTSGSSRFSIIFKSSSVTTSTERNKPSTPAIQVINGNNLSIINCSTLGNASVNIYNVQGQLVYNENLRSNNQLLKYQFSQGVYMVSIEDNGKKLIQKVIIQ